MNSNKVHAIRVALIGATTAAIAWCTVNGASELLRGHSNNAAVSLGTVAIIGTEFAAILISNRRKK